MPIEKLDHVNIRTARLDVMIEWYTRILGLRPGNRPDFPFSGAWLYAGTTAVVHLIATEGHPGVGSEAELKLEHFAFSASDLGRFENTLNASGEMYQCTEIPEFGLIQVNLWDPDGNHLHVDFPIDKR